MKILCVDFDEEKATKISKGMLDRFRRCWRDFNGMASDQKKLKGLIDDFEKATYKKDTKKVFEVLKKLHVLYKGSEKEWFEECYEDFPQDKKRLEDALYE